MASIKGFPVFKSKLNMLLPRSCRYTVELIINGLVAAAPNIPAPGSGKVHAISRELMFADEISDATASRVPA
jgi:hypothetical protein